MMIQQSVVDLRRERDAIRVEMERLVRTMQGLETDVEQRRPGWEAKRDELSLCRQQLSDLRAKMRNVMEGVGVPSSTRSASSASTTLSSSGASGRRPYEPSSPMPRSAAAPDGLYSMSESSTVSPTRPRGAAGGGVQQQYGGMSAKSPSRARSSEQQLSPSRSQRSAVAFPSSRGDAPQLVAPEALERRHAEEKRLFQQEVARLSEEMERRHESERQLVIAQLQEEEEKRREVERAAQRLEEAQRALEALKRSHAQAGGTTATNLTGLVTKEADQLRRRYRPVQSDSSGLNSSDGTGLK